MTEVIETIERLIKARNRNQIGESDFQKALHAIPVKDILEVVKNKSATVKTRELAINSLESRDEPDEALNILECLCDIYHSDNTVVVQTLGPAAAGIIMSILKKWAQVDLDLVIKFNRKIGIFAAMEINNRRALQKQREAESLKNK